MQRLAQHIVLILCLITTPWLWGQTGENAVFDIENTGKGYTLHFLMGAFSLDEAADGFIHPRAAGLDVASSAAGTPALPTACRLLMLPRDAKLTLASLTASADITLALPDGSLPAPAPDAVAKDQEPLPLHADRQAYAQHHGTANHQPVQIEELGIMGSQRLFRISVHPFAYDHDTRTVTVVRRLDAVLESTSAMPDAVLPPQPPTLLIVSREEFRQGLQPFVRWKRQEGFRVQEIYATTHKRDSIRPLIVEAMEQHRSPDMPYLLLVGDVGQMQAYLGNTQPKGFELHITDLRYADLDSDYLPDMVYGRWPVNDTAQLGTLVRKTLQYEQCHDLDSTALQRVLLVAGSESRPPAPITANGEVNYLKQEVAKHLPSLDTLCYYNPASANQRQQILDDIQQGTSLLAYTAHCNMGGWNNPKVQIEQLDSLAPCRPTVWVNNCCMSNNYSGTCFGEQLLRKANGGAVAVIGATNNTMWNEDYYWAVGYKYPLSSAPAYDPLTTGGFDPLWDETPDPTTVGEMLLAGNLAVASAGSPFDRFYWEIYCLLGDPTLRPQMGLPLVVPLTLESPIHVGDTAVQAVSSPGVRVSLMQADSLLGWAMADSNGVAHIATRWCIDTAGVTLTATGSSVKPVWLEASPAAATAPMALFDVHVGDSLLHCTVANLSQDTLKNIWVGLEQDSIDIATGATVACSPTPLALLAPGQRTPLALSYQPTVAGQHPLWSARLVATADTACAALHLNHLMPPSYPTVDFALLEPDNGTARSLKPGQDYTLQATVAGCHDSLRLVACTLPGGDTVGLYEGALPVAALAFTTPDSLTHLRLDYSLTTGRHTDSETLYLVAGHGTDCMEHGMQSYPWHSTGSQPWQVDSAAMRSGSRCLRSGSIDYRQTSDLTLDVHLLADDTVSYWARTSCEEVYDKLTFSIDGNQVGGTLSGESGWKRFAVPVAKGRHTLRWRYVKDEEDDQGSDCAWIDDVHLPLALWSAPYGYFDDCQQLGIGDTAAASSPRVTVVPNPGNGLFTLTGSGEAEWVELTDIVGRPVLSLHHKQSLPLRLDLRHLPDGMYLLRMAHGGRIDSHTIVIQH